MVNKDNRATTIVAGSLKVEGIIKNIEFNSNTMEVLFIIVASDNSSSIKLELPRPKKAVVEAIQSMGVKNLKGSLINLNTGTISVMSKDVKSDGSTRAASESQSKIGSPGILV